MIKKQVLPPLLSRKTIIKRAAISLACEGRDTTPPHPTLECKKVLFSWLDEGLEVAAAP